jgi:glutamyl-Q tRNA(Asp) synthetase
MPLFPGWNWHLPSRNFNDTTSPISGRIASHVAHCTGRFAPSPTGPLHAGSLVAALASWLDARAHGGQWLVRLEDVDTPRCVPGAAAFILHQLATCGLVSDGPVWVQSERGHAYAQALSQLQTAGLAYPCACTRKDIEQALQASGQTRPRHAELRYPGTCRTGTHGQPGRAWRMLTTKKFEQKQPITHDSHAMAAPYFDNEQWHWFDRRTGWHAQDVAQQVGDFVLKRADDLWAYQLAVVVDDAAQGITHIVRGADLADNTPRQILLQHALGLPHPSYLHTPLVLGANGEKLSKQNGATALDLNNPLAALNAAAQALGLPAQQGEVASALAAWVPAWTHLRAAQKTKII